MNTSWCSRGSVLVAVIIAGVACGGTESTGGAPPGTEQSPAAADPGATDGGGNESEAASQETGRGYVVLNSFVGEATDASAMFTRSVLPSQTLEADGCAVVGKNSEYVNASAGTITITAGARSTVLEFVTDKHGKGAGYGNMPLSGGTDPLALDVPIKVETAGADIPAFELTALPAELPTVTTSPADAVALGQAFEVSWPAVAADQVVASLAGDRGEVVCWADASKGKVVFSSERIAAVTTGGPSKVVGLTVDGVRRSEGRFGDFLVTLFHQARGNAVPLTVR